MIVYKYSMDTAQFHDLIAKLLTILTFDLIAVDPSSKVSLLR